VFNNYVLINFSLAVIVVLLGVKLQHVLTTHIEIPAKPASQSQLRHERKIRRTADHTDSRSYDIVAAGNLFNPSRSAMEKPVQGSPPVSKKDLPQLFGTVIMGDERLAILEDRSARKTSLYKVNDSVSGFVLSRILEDRVILQRGDDSLEVKLRAEKKFRRPVMTQKRAAAVRNAPKRRRPRRVRRARPRRTPSPATAGRIER